MYRNNDIMEKELNEIGGKATDYREFIQLDLPVAVAIVSCGGRLESGRGKRRVYGCTWIHGKGTAGNQTTKNGI